MNALRWLLEAPGHLYRWARGGHWEQWYVDGPVYALVWHRVDACYHATRRPPNGLCRGLPHCEDYR